MDVKQDLISLISKDSKVLCLLAPSFVAEFDYPDIIYTLRALGFDNVVELTFGAKMINHGYYEILKSDSDSRTWIASPCPTLVQLIRTKYPHLVRNLVPIHSPMGAMALICNKFFPGYKKVFVGPCITKKFEAKEIGTVDLSITFKELLEILDQVKPVIKEEHKQTFNKFYNDYTKIYPISGGLSETLHYSKILDDKDILVTDGIREITQVLNGFKNGFYEKYKFLDILTCKGGCINGPGMCGTRLPAERKQRIIGYRDFARTSERDIGRAGTKVVVEDIDFTRKFE
ncbi:hypothetical protein JW962_03015 [Candidatus Dojkabacteria bacterium]|nr:hypothetical protein [Candidatus Dojkabacteria bacterium]